MRTLLAVLVTACPALADRHVSITVVGPDGAPLPNVTVAYDAGATEQKLVTGQDGRCVVQVGEAKIVLSVTEPGGLSASLSFLVPDQPKSVAVIQLDGMQADLKYVTTSPLEKPYVGVTPDVAPAAMSTTTGTYYGGAGGGQTCATAQDIGTGAGTFSFNNLTAVQDGPDECDNPAFPGTPQVDHDVWFTWTSDADGPWFFETCGGLAAGVDTKLALYAGGGCPGGPGTADGCDDDGCSLAAPWDSRLSFNATNGTVYTLRVGTFPGAAGGAGQFALEPEGPIPRFCFGPPFGSGGGTSCSSAEDIGSTLDNIAFDNTAGGTSSIGASCAASNSDRWYIWTAPATGLFTVDTCSGLTIDTVLSVYQGNCALLNELGCNDDTCGTQSAITFPTSVGVPYRIRIAAFGESAGPGDLGTGTFCINGVIDEPLDCEFGTNGQPPDQLGHGSGGIVAATSDANPGAGFQVADNFQLAASGSVSGICFWGIYVDFTLLVQCGPGPGDDFSVTYYNDDGGGLTPGSVLAGPLPLTITSSGTTGLTIATGIGPIDEYGYSATHTPVSLGTDCYWVSVQNNTTGNCFWLWSTSGTGDGRAAQAAAGVYGAIDYDLAWVLDQDTTGPSCSLVGPPNDTCENREPISGEGSFNFDNTLANQDGPDHPGVCDKFAQPSLDHDLWYNWTAPCTADVLLTTCNQTSVDTKIAVYGTTDCNNLGDPIACNDDTCGFQSQVQFAATSGSVYKLRIGTFPGASGGPGSFSLTCLVPIENDDCDNAAPVAVPSIVSGDTTIANSDPNAPFCGTSVDSPGVWYSITGTGTTITATTCDDASYDTKLHVYCGPCDNLTCVAGNDDDPACSGFTSTVSWCSQAGSTYLLFVEGFGGATGAFNVTLSEDGVGCNADVQCQTAGACCVGPTGQDCIVTTADDCAAQGGIYKGDDTNCGDAFFAAGTCDAPFEDVCGLAGAIVHALGDDTSDPVNFGFSIDFFGTNQNSGLIASNGYVTFDGIGGDFTNNPCPDPATPNDAIYPCWDDWSPNQGGTVCSNTLGAAPNRTWVGQWTDVPHFGGFGPGTFQVRINEIDNSIEFRYGSIPAGISETVGIENADATESVCFGPAASDTCTRIDYVTTSSPCSECFLVFGSDDGPSVFGTYLHDFDVQVDGVFASMEVLMDNLGRVPLDRVMRYAGSQQARLQQQWGQPVEPAFYVQVVMWNPYVFPNQPMQASQPMAVTVLPDGQVYGTLYGTQAGGIHIQQPREVSIDGQRWIEFPFVIEGL